MTYLSIYSCGLVVVMKILVLYTASMEALCLLRSSTVTIVILHPLDVLQKWSSSHYRLGIFRT